MVVLIGPSGCGKSSFARKHFKLTQVISSDHCRALVSDDESNQSVSREAFEIVHFIAERRLSVGRLTVIDATSVQPDARRPFIAMASKSNAVPVAIVFNLPEEVCLERDCQRPDRQVGPEVIRRQREAMLRHLHNLEREGFQIVYTVSSPEEADETVIETHRLST